MYYEPGLYRFRITQQGFGEAKSSGNPQFLLRGEPLAQVAYDQDGNEEEYPCDRQYERTIALTITPNTVDRVIANLVKLGWPGRKFSDLLPESANSFSFVGIEFIAECKHEASNKGDGKMFEKWDFPFEQKASEPIKSVTSVAKKLDNLFGDKLKRVAAEKAARTPQPGANYKATPPGPPTSERQTVPDDVPEFGSPEDDTDIPF